MEEAETWVAELVIRRHRARCCWTPTTARSIGSVHPSAIPWIVCCSALTGPGDFATVVLAGASLTRWEKPFTPALSRWEREQEPKETRTPSQRVRTGAKRVVPWSQPVRLGAWRNLW